MWFKHCKVFLFYCVISNYANIHDGFIYDYFVHKNVPNVIGFTCDRDNDDLSLLKRFNEMGIRVMLYKLYNSGSIIELIRANYYKLGIFIDLRCYDSGVVKNVLSEAASYRLYDELRCWLLLDRNLEDAIHTIDDRSFGLSTDFVIVPMNRSSEELVLYDVYNPWKQGQGQLNITRLATWDPRRGLNFHVTEIKCRRRSNLHGMTFRTAFFRCKYKPENISLEQYLENTEKNRIDAWPKFGYVVLKYVAEMFNISLRIEQTTRWNQKNETVGPISRALNNSEIEISGTPLIMSNLSVRMLKFVYPSWPFRTCFLLRSPQPNDIKFGEILKPFAMEIWLLMTFTLIICGTVLFATLTFDGIDDMEIRCSNCLLITIGAICQQGTDVMMNWISSRATFLCIMVCSYLMFNYYSAVIVAVRLSEPIIKINDSLNELAKTGLKVASEPLLYFEFFIKENKWETQMFYSKRWSITPEKERYIHLEKGMQLVREGSHAYHTHPDVGYPYISRFYTDREICELTEVNLATLNYFTMAVTYNSTVVELMKIGFARLSEYGIRRRQLNWLTATKPICDQSVLPVTSVTMNEFAPHLLVLAIGAIIAIGMCAFERYFFKHHRNMERTPRIYDRLRRIIICDANIRIAN